ncbi:microsomal dipeptidase-like Zn-dependent dipeptidase [Chryseobacterium bernardetii]|uniref:Microsomal dipeptidase-like Zn-dependent dipeptidase n=2 Tax=Chryseobacterium TaxID=59732 RepID=A0A543EIU2_9FLAO|nr:MULTISPECIES: membrane dipeptidase [Chryseobacterium]MDR6369915.1 microsomal dipeptidase-like Zn-dependent dipeptidase [Chryseobacterium vietnamense]MDR6440842.1 microsomal dipeptidase-like Zn-dependent dipeptidase [Chryseobacterium bernardetii]TQM21479.1 microsomal dipeptidase-like Zn-dependent dipeptidase [Chryseobacterium aquifrigidense]
MNAINVDLHCDLLCYLLEPGSLIDDKELGCSLPYLQEGNVKLQVMAIYSATGENSTVYAAKQSEIFSDLLQNESFFLFDGKNYKNPENTGKVGVIASIENASGFCGEDDTLETGFKNLEAIIEKTQRVFYLGITHHTENRFGGGNNSDIGLKDDGKVLLDYLSEKNIAIDLAHTSDQLAYGILNYIDQRNYKIHVIASHSNYRQVHDKKRNLPDELAKEIIKRKGLIGLNFIRNCVDDTNPEMLYEHIQYGLNLGAEDAIAYGADFFFCKNHPDKSRHPFFFEGYNDASAFNAINKEIEKRFSSELLEKISHKNALNFIENMYQ